MKSNFTIETLLEDPSFQNYVLEKSNDDIEKWSSILKANPDQATVIQQAKTLLLQLKVEKHTLSPENKTALWQEIDANIKASHHSNFKMVRIWTSVAASIAIGLLLFFFFQKSQPTLIVTQYGETTEVILPDSSIVHVNSGSEIQYDEKNWFKERKVNLTGEAFFDVKKGASFTVTSAAGETKVLGTSFNIFARDESYEVQCFTGKVAVRMENQEAELTPGQQVSSGEISKLGVTPFEITKTPHWMQGIFHFKNQPLFIVMQELERQYNVRIHLPQSLKNLRYTGSFEKGNLSKALKNVTWPLHLEAEIGDELINIYSLDE